MKNKKYHAVYVGEDTDKLKQGEAYWIAKTQNENEVKIEFKETAVYYYPSDDFEEIKVNS